MDHGRPNWSEEGSVNKALSRLLLSPLGLEAVAIGVVIAICPPWANAEEAIAEKFRKVVVEIEAWCKEDKRGPYLDRSDPGYKKKARDTSCDILKLEPRDWRQVKMTRLESQPYPVPEHWLSTAEGRFAHSIELPDARARVSNIYKPGITGAEYFDRLCEQGNGEFIFRKVSSLVGIRQDRAWTPFSGAYSHVVFWTREKGGLHDTADYLVQPPLGGYQFVEVRLPELEAKRTGAIFRVFYRGEKSSKDFAARSKDGAYVRIPYIVAQTTRNDSEARHGFTWRGIWPPNGIENGIEGSELIVYATAPFEVLGYQRQYFRHLPDDRQPDARITRTVGCASRSMMPPHEFVQHVLIPASR
jgi:hypothetical protein